MKKTYKARIEYYKTESDKIKKEISRCYWLRLMFFILLVVTIVLFFSANFNPIYLSVLLAFLLVSFTAIIRKDLKLVEKEKLYNKFIDINEGELKSLLYDFSFRNDGEQYKHLNPNLSADFDIFGKGSLYSYINRSVTKGGRDKFAKSLVMPEFDTNKIELQSLAIEELAENISFVQNFQALGCDTKLENDEVSNLHKWLNLESAKIWGIKPLCYVLPYINGAILLSIIVGILPIAFLSLPAIISLPWVYYNFLKVSKAHDLLGRSAATFKKYSKLIRLIENEKFNSMLLKEYQNEIIGDYYKARKAIDKLNSLLERFDIRYNIYVSLLLNSLYLMDLQNYLNLDKWKQQYKNEVRRWFVAIENFDSLIGYATYNCNNKEISCKAIVLENKSFEIDSICLAHPLIPVAENVDNDICLQGKPLAMVITGANMAGKSTFLRTVVVNLILAMNGARTRAKEFSYTPCQILSSIKIQDSLMNKESYFYAELKRLRYLLDELDNEPRSLIILDEMLRGTNTKDKQAGSIGIIKKIIEKRGVAIIATHDLVIGEMEKEYPQIIKNYNFEAELADNQLVFDYKLKHGIATKFNASFLMKKMEII